MKSGYRTSSLVLHLSSTLSLRSTGKKRKLKRQRSKIFPPTPSELPDSSSAGNDLSPNSEETAASPNPQSAIHATKPTSTDDAALEDWETIEKPENISPGAKGSESNQEGPMFDSVAADLGAPLSTSMNVKGKKDVNVEQKGEEKKSDVGSKAEVRHGLLKDW